MDLNFSWQSPTVSEDVRKKIEEVVVTMASRIGQLVGRHQIMVNFVADIPANSPLLATVEDATTGYLLGALETPRADIAFRFVLVEPGNPRALLAL